MKLLDKITDAIIRRRLALHETPIDRYRVRIARTAREYRDAFRLVHAAYAFQGIVSVRDRGPRITPHHLLSEGYVLVAYDGDRLVGTLTVTLDSPAGLPLDKDYPEAIDRLRAQGERIVEYGSLAVVQRCWHDGVTTLLNMAAHTLATRLLYASHVVAGINPAAFPVYRATFNCRRMGPARHHAQLEAPVIGMHGNLEEAVQHIRRCFRKPMETGHLPAEHFGGLPFAAVDLPERLPDTQAARWKLPRPVFQELFLRDGDRVAALEPQVARHLRRTRTRGTLTMPSLPHATRAQPPRAT